MYVRVVDLALNQADKPLVSPIFRASLLVPSVVEFAKNVDLDLHQLQDIFRENVPKSFDKTTWDSLFHSKKVISLKNPTTNY